MSLLRNKGAYDALFGTTPETAPDPGRVGYSDYFLRALQFLAADDPLHPDMVMGREQLDGEQTDRTNGGHWSMPIFRAYNDRVSAEFITMLKTKERIARQNKLPTAVQLVKDIGKPNQDARILAIVREYHYWAAISKDIAAIERLNGIGMFNAEQFQADPEDEQKAEVAPAPAPAAASPASIYPDLSASDPEPAPAAAAPASFSVEDGANSEDEQQGSPVVSPALSAASEPPPDNDAPELSLDAPARGPDDPQPGMSAPAAFKYAFERIYEDAVNLNVLDPYFKEAWTRFPVSSPLHPRNLLQRGELEKRVPTRDLKFWVNTDFVSRQSLMKSYAPVATADFLAKLEKLSQIAEETQSHHPVHIVKDLGVTQDRMMAIFAYQYWFELSRDPAKQAEVLKAIGASSSSVVADSHNVNDKHPQLSDDEAFDFAFDALYVVEPPGRVYTAYLDNEVFESGVLPESVKRESLVPPRRFKDAAPNDLSPIWKNTDDEAMQSVWEYYLAVANRDFCESLAGVLANVKDIRMVRPASFVKKYGGTQERMAALFEYQYWFNLSRVNPEDVTTALSLLGVLKAPAAAAASSSSFSSSSSSASGASSSSSEAQTQFSPYAGPGPADGGSVSSSEAPTYVDSEATTQVYGDGSRLNARKPSKW